MKNSEQIREGVNFIVTDWHLSGNTVKWLDMLEFTGENGRTSGPGIQAVGVERSKQGK